MTKTRFYAEAGLTAEAGLKSGLQEGAPRVDGEQKRKGADGQENEEEFAV